MKKTITSKEFWPGDVLAARRIQSELRKKIRIRPLKKNPLYVAGVDAAFDRGVVMAAASLFEYPSLIQMADAVSTDEVRFPYIPGFLSFREGSAIIAAKCDRADDYIRRIKGLDSRIFEKPGETLHLPYLI